MAKFGLRSMTQAAITSGGPTQDFNISGIDQPKAAIYQMTSATAVPELVAPARHSIGFTDGTTERVVEQMLEDGAGLTTAATKDTGDLADTATVIQISGTGTEARVGEADHNQWNSTGSKLNWADLPDAAYQVIAAYFFGTDLECKVVEAAGSATQDQETTVELGFRPDALICLSYMATTAFAADAAVAGARLSFGCCAFDQGTIRQWMYSTRSSDRPASTENTSEIRNDAVFENMTITTGAGSRGVRMEITGVTDTGFKWTTKNGAASFAVAILAIRCPHRRVWAGIPTLDVTSTGPQSTTSLGFKPMAYLMLATGMDTVNVIEDAGLTTKYSLGIVSGSEANCAGIQAEDGTTASNTDSHVNAKVARVTNASQADIYALSHTSFDNTGFTVNVDTAAPAARLVAVLAFGEDLPDTDFMRRYEHTRAPNTSLRM